MQAIQMISAWMKISARYYQIRDYLRALHDYPKGCICAVCKHPNFFCDDIGFFSTDIGVLCRRCFYDRGYNTAER